MSDDAEEKKPDSEIRCLILVGLTYGGDVLTLPYVGNPPETLWFDEYVIQALKNTPVPNHE